MVYPKLIGWYYNNGVNPFYKTLDKESLTTIYAKNEKAEEIAKQGHIAALNLGVGNKDPYFIIKRQIGFTKKAKKYRTLYKQIHQSHPELENVLHSLNVKLKDYGDYVFIKLAYLDNYVNPFETTGIFESPHFIKKSNFTIDLLLKLIEFRPYAVSGGQITDYQNKEIPELLFNLKQEFPELYKQLCKASETVKQFDKTISYVGKTAYIKSLNPGTVELRIGFIDKQLFYWDGQVLTNTITAYDNSELKQAITPSDNTTVTIIDDATITSNTKFLN